MAESARYCTVTLLRKESDMSDIVFDGMIFDRLREIGEQSDRIASLEAENERLRLTGAEREAATMSETNERSVASAGSVAERPLGDPEIAAEILQLRVAELETAIRRLAEQDATLSVCDGNVTVTMDATLTDEEREAIERAIGFCECTASPLPTSNQIATLRGLLERLGGGR